MTCWLSRDIPGPSGNDERRSDAASGQSGDAGHSSLSLAAGCLPVPAWLGAVGSCPPDRQVCAVGLAWLLPGSRLPDQSSHHLPGEQRLGRISLDERPAVDHLVLLQARVPLPDLVHPHHPVVLPLVRPGLGGGPAGRPSAAQRDNPHVGVHCGPGGGRGGSRPACAELPGLRRGRVCSGWSRRAIGGCHADRELAGTARALRPGAVVRPARPLPAEECP